MAPLTSIVAQTQEQAKQALPGIVAALWAQAQYDEVLRQKLNPLETVVSFDSDGTIFDHTWQRLKPGTSPDGNKTIMSSDYRMESNIEFLKLVVPLLKGHGLTSSIVSNQYEKSLENPKLMDLSTVYDEYTKTEGGPLFKLEVIGRENTFDGKKTKGLGIVGRFGNTMKNVIVVDDTETKGAYEAISSNKAQLKVVSQLIGGNNDSHTSSESVMKFCHHGHNRTADEKKKPFGFCAESALLSMLKKSQNIPQEHLPIILQAFDVKDIKALGEKLADSMGVPQPTNDNYVADINRILLDSLITPNAFVKKMDVNSSNNYYLLSPPEKVPVVIRRDAATMLLTVANANNVLLNSGPNKGQLKQGAKFLTLEEFPDKAAIEALVAAPPPVPARRPAGAAILPEGATTSSPPVSTRPPAPRAVAAGAVASLPIPDLRRPASEPTTLQSQAIIPLDAVRALVAAQEKADTLLATKRNIFSRIFLPNALKNGAKRIMDGAKAEFVKAVTVVDGKKPSLNQGGLDAIVQKDANAPGNHKVLKIILGNEDIAVNPGLTVAGKPLPTFLAESLRVSSDRKNEGVALALDCMQSLLPKLTIDDRALFKGALANVMDSNKSAEVKSMMSRITAEEAPKVVGQKAPSGMSASLGSFNNSSLSSPLSLSSEESLSDVDTKMMEMAPPVPPRPRPLLSKSESKLSLGAAGVVATNLDSSTESFADILRSSFESNNIKEEKLEGAPHDFYKLDGFCVKIRENGEVQVKLGVPGQKLSFGNGQKGYYDINDKRLESAKATLEVMAGGAKYERVSNVSNPAPDPANPVGIKLGDEASKVR